MARTAASSRSRTDVEIAFQACRLPFFIIFLLSFFINLLALTTPLYLLQIYEHVISSESIETLVMLTLIAVVALAVYAILDGIRRAMLSRIGSWFDDRLQPDVLAAAIYVAQNRESSAASQAWRDVGNIRSFFANGAAVTLFDAPWTFIFIGAMYIIHPLLGLIGLAGVIVLFLIVVLNEALTRPSLLFASESAASAQSRFDVLLRNASTVIAMGMLPGAMRTLLRDRMAGSDAQLAAGTVTAAIRSVSRFCRLVTHILVMAAATWLVVKHGLSPAAIFASSILVGRALAPVENAAGAWRALTSVRAGYRRLKRIMTLAPKASTLMPLPLAEGVLTVESASCAASDTNRAVLRRINLDVAPGTILAITGPSGAGKSTLGRLLAGVLPPSAGHVRMDGTDIALWLASGGHAHLGYLSQGVELFAGSVKDNIARLEDADPADVINAARLAGLHETIQAMPMGYNTEIGEFGGRLSVGERQRLGLARAFFGGPRLVVLDEPSTGLDNQAVAALRAAILQMQARGTTLIIITHRIDLLRLADKIAVMRNGMIDILGERAEMLQKLAPRPMALGERKKDRSRSGAKSLVQAAMQAASAASVVAPDADRDARKSPDEQDGQADGEDGVVGRPSQSAGTPRLAADMTTTMP